MRVLLTTHQFFPAHYAGTEVAARDTGVELLRRGHEVHVLTVDPRPGHSGPEVGAVDYGYRGLRVHALRIPERNPARQLGGEPVRLEYSDQAVGEHVRRWARELAPDVVHMFHLARLTGAALDALRELGVPLVFTATDFWSICVRSILMRPGGELCGGPDGSNCLECMGVDRWHGLEAPSRPSRRRALYRRLAGNAVAATGSGDPRAAAVRAVLERAGFLRRRLERVDAIVAPTVLMRDMLVANGLPEALIRVHRYSIDTAPFNAVHKTRGNAAAPLHGVRKTRGNDAAPLNAVRKTRGDDAARRRGGKAGAGVRFAYVGTISHPKGVHILIRAFRQVTDPHATLEIIGNVDAEPDYFRELHALAVGDHRIRFAGGIPNERIPERLRRIDVQVVPSIWHENAPLTIYSAQAAGVPVVASNHRGMSEVVSPGENGLLFEPGDVSGLASQLRRLAADPELIEQLAANARQPLSAAEGVDELLALYEEIRAAAREAPALPRDGAGPGGHGAGSAERIPVAHLERRDPSS